MFKNGIVIGTGKLAFTCAKILIEQEIECKVFEYGEYAYSQLSILCEHEKIEYHSINKKELTEYLIGINSPSLVVSASNIYIFPKQVVDNQNLLIVNFHPALLPKHPGRNAEAWSIFEGDKFTGITWHLVDEQIDHGKIVYQLTIPLDERTTSLRLMSKQFAAAANAFKEISTNLITNKLKFINTNNQSEVSVLHYSKDIPNEGRLNLDWSMKKMSQFLRAMDYGKLEVLGRPYLIYEEKKYIWDKYKFDTNDSAIKSNIKKGIICNSGQVLLLVNFREDNEGEKNLF